MGFSVLEKWSGVVASKATSGQAKAKRVWTVVGTGATVATVDNAIYATGIANINDTFSGVRTDLFCSDVTGAQISLNLIEVTANYGASQYQEANPNPLSEPAIISVTTQTITEDADLDIDGNPIQNLNGQVLTGGKATYNLDVVSITKNLTAFDLAFARTYRNTVNASSFTITTKTGSPVTVPRGYARVVSFLPARTFKLADTYVPCTLTLEIADSNAWSHPFQNRIIHTGSEAFTQETGEASPIKGRIVTKNGGMVPSHDIRLDSNGKPWETSTYATLRDQGKANGITFVTSPLASGILSPMVIGLDTTTSSNCVYLIYRRCFESNFTTMLTALGL